MFSSLPDGHTVEADADAYGLYVEGAYVGGVSIETNDDGVFYIANGPDGPDDIIDARTSFESALNLVIANAH